MNRGRHEHPPGLGSVVAGLALASLVLLWSVTGSTLSGWTTASVSNGSGAGGTTNTAATGTLAFAHAYGSSSCAAGPRVSGTTQCNGTIAPASPSGTSAVSAADPVTNNGLASAAQTSLSVGAASCAPVSLANRVSATRPLLPRYDTAFQTSGPMATTNAVTFSGLGYAAAASVQTLHGGDTTATAKNYGVGVWFRAASGQSGPLIEFDTSATSTSGTDDQVLWLTATGTLSFLQSATSVKAAATTTTPTGTSYANGAWHFVYVRMAVTANNTGTSTTISLDGALKVTNSVLVPYTNTTGYWHLGFAAPVTTGLGSAYFAGALSNPVVFQGGNAPIIPTTTQLSSQSSFTTWAANAGEHWLLGDTGTTTYATTPSFLTASACSMLTISWTFTSPSATAVSGVTLAAFAAAGSYPVSADPEPGTTQTSTIAISRGGTYTALIAGLRLFVPFSYSAQTGTSWPLTFLWSSVDSVVLG